MNKMKKIGSCSVYITVLIGHSVLQVGGVQGFVTPSTVVRDVAAGTTGAATATSRSSAWIALPSGARQRNPFLVSSSSHIPRRKRLHRLQLRLATTTDKHNVEHHDETAPYTETVRRSAMKTLVWKVLSAAVSFQTTLLVTGGQWTLAMKFVILSFLPKFLVLFFIDRLVNVLPIQQQLSSKLQRSFVKVLLWRVLALMGNLGLAIFVLHDYQQASQLVSLDFVIKFLLSLTYERIWAQLPWGKADVVVVGRSPNGGTVPAQRCLETE
jgi:hypothetical protein